MWCSLAVSSASAYVLAPFLLGFERVEATVTRGDFHSAIVFDEPIDFTYRVGQTRYEVTAVNIPQSLEPTWVGGPGSKLPIYCNHWFPSWWSWEEPPTSVRQRCNVFLGLVLVFGLLIVRDASGDHQPPKGIVER